MHACIIERLTAAGNPHKAGALLKGLRPQLRHLEEVSPAYKPSIFLAKCDDILRERLADAGHVLHQRHRRRVEVHADAVHAVLHDSAQRLIEPLLVHVVLILADSDRLRIDLDQLRERVLHAPCHRRGAALLHIKVRKFLRCQLAGGVD